MCPARKFESHTVPRVIQRRRPGVVLPSCDRPDICVVRIAAENRAGRGQPARPLRRPLELRLDRKRNSAEKARPK